VPGIHDFIHLKDVDGRDKPGHDGGIEFVIQVKANEGRS
jgi:hypothetical protein